MKTILIGNTEVITAPHLIKDKTARLTAGYNLNELKRAICMIDTIDYIENKERIEMELR